MTEIAGREVVLVHRSGGSSLQVLPNAYSSWDAYLYSFGGDGHIRIKKVGESQDRQELILRAVAAFGKAYRWRDWIAPIWPCAGRAVGDAEVLAFLSELEEAAP